MHRDVKPSNILMDTQCGIHVIDFGLARRISPTQPVARSDSATISVLSAQSEDLGSLQTEQSEESAEEPRPLLQRPILQRQLTRHIATRWYRAPEIIILEVNIITWYDG
jgi:chromosome undetermined scaffold_6, whole genome shotgun sequence